MQLLGRTAVVTGAGGGIGRAISASLARRGCHLALADINPAGLAETAAMLGATATAGGGELRVSTHALDVGDPKAIAAFPEQVSMLHGGADILVNNAGVAIGGSFREVSEADFEWLFSINFWGVVRMTRAFLPLLQARPEARLVNLSSLFGLIAPPGQTAYCASKFAVRGFSESLRHELAGTRVGVTLVHPGGVATGIARNARIANAFTPEEVERARASFEAKLKLAPETAGEVIVRGVEQRRARVLVGSDAKLASVIERLAPTTYWNLLGRAFNAK